MHTTRTLAAYSVLLALGFIASAQPSRSIDDPGLEAAFQRAVYAAEPEGGGFRAANPAQKLAARFNAGGVSVEEEGNAGFGMRLTGYGYGERLVKPLAAPAQANGNRIEYRRGSLTEWYVNLPAGLEQGFTLDSRPGRPERGERLILALEVTGGQRPSPTPEGDAVLVGSLRYSGLRAWDATGRELETRMQVRDREIRLAVADAGAQYPLMVDPWIQQAKLAASDGAANDYFGTSVALSGDTAVIGAPGHASNQGAAYVFTRRGGAWSQEAKLAAFDGAADDFFGTSVAVRDSDNTAIIGAYGQAGSRGAAYVFTRSGDTWSLQAKLTASDSAPGDQFGRSVVLSEDTAVIGAYYRAVRQGATYVFERRGNTWRQQAKLTASDAAEGDAFGYSLAMALDTLVIGAFGKASNQGAAYVFTRSDSAWHEQGKLTASNGAAFDQFGFSVAVSGDMAVIGAPVKSNRQGAAYVFTRNGSAWKEQARLAASDDAFDSAFGNSVAVGGEAVLIGAPAEARRQGAVYLFSRSGSAWKEQAKLTAPDRAAHAYFGNAVAASRDTALIGVSASNPADQGAAYVFTTPPDKPAPASPSRGATGVSPTTMLLWNAADRTSTHDVRSEH